MKNPNLSEWATLYQAANKFHNLSPWTWMSNEDLFSVVNPQNGEMGYCSILGAGKQEFGLGVFLGDKGYMRWLKLMSEEPGADAFDVTIMTPMLSLLFADRDDLQKQDIDVIHSLGLQFRGKNNWPLFRSQRPGYTPWFLDREEVIFLTAAIDQASVVADRVHNDELDVYDGADEDLVLTRYHDGGTWKENWRKPELTKADQSKNAEDNAILNEAEMLLLRNSLGQKQNGYWELDIFIMPVPIGPKANRPYFPLCFLAIDRQQGIVIGNQMEEPWLNLAQKREVIINIFKNAGHVPRNIRVKSLNVKEILNPVAANLGISVQVGPISQLDSFKTSLNRYLSG